MCDYMKTTSKNHTYGPTFFRRRIVSQYMHSAILMFVAFFFYSFRMYCSLFLRIVQAVEVHSNYFLQKRDRARRLELSHLQKIIVAFIMLCYSVSVDFTHDYI